MTFKELWAWAKRFLDKTGGENLAHVDDEPEEVRQLREVFDREGRRDRRQLRIMRWSVALAVIVTLEGIPHRIDNWIMSRRLEYLALHPTVLWAKDAPGGVVLEAAKTISLPEVSDHQKVVERWVRQTFQLFPDAAQPHYVQELNDARALLGGSALVARWDEIQSAKPKARDGYVIMVTNARCRATNFTPESSVATLSCQWREQTTRNGREVADLERGMLVHTKTTERRKGAEYGIEVFGFTPPETVQNHKLASR